MSERSVRQERTGWRDQELSQRHRAWGFNCPAVDLDFLMVEYNLGKPVAIVEYKRYNAKMPNFKHPTYRALMDLADGYTSNPLPFLIAFYWPGVWAFKIYPVNARAREEFETGEELTEREYVTRLYILRTAAITKQVLEQLKRENWPSGG